MSTILLGWNNPDGGDLRLDADNLIEVGDPLIAELLFSLHTDAPAQPGDPAPEGVVRHGYWARAFDPRAVPGSKLWMLPYVRPLSRALAFAQIWTLEATRWLVFEKRVVSIDAKASIGTRGPSWIDIEVDVRPTLETRKRFRTEALYGT